MRVSLVGLSDSERLAKTSACSALRMNRMGGPELTLLRVQTVQSLPELRNGILRDDLHIPSLTHNSAPLGLVQATPSGNVTPGQSYYLCSNS